MDIGLLAPGRIRAKHAMRTNYFLVRVVKELPFCKVSTNTAFLDEIVAFFRMNGLAA